MKRSTDRILTTHAGSLPRPADLLTLVERDGPKAFDEPEAATRLRAAVGEIVRHQAELGIDVVDDGEYGKPSFVSYINERLGGYEVDSTAGPRNQWSTSREGQSFPEFYASTHAASRHTHMICTGPITYKGQARLKRDIDNLKAALNGAKNGAKVEEVFMPAISPSNIEDWQRNAYYKTQQEYVFAIAEAMREEYETIVNAGFLLQIDDPRLVTYYIIHPEASIADCRKWAEVRVGALNHALRNIAPEKIRFHTCYGINMGPRIHDMELKDIVDIILKIRAGAYSFEAANPRHEHEWKVWKDVKLPDGKILIPGVISHSTVLVEHPELVAERIVRFASVVGRENIIAGSDCGFATFAGSKEVHPSIVWAKFKALSDGARIASKELWGR
ncbi:MAG TPA: cobalamin-independent methionine synthase II family protein [Xanthobacteraceae bacterium]|nr:cobalamin-independent methionine synthase II family protein [Xanthobacteraceae bacterium]